MKLCTHKLTVIDEGVAAGEEVRGADVLVGVEVEGERAIEGNAPTGRYRAAVPSAERAVDQLRAFRMHDFRVHVHVLVDATKQHQ